MMAQMGARVGAWQNGNDSHSERTRARARQRGSLQFINCQDNVNVVSVHRAHSRIHTHTHTYTLYTRHGRGSEDWTDCSTEQWDVNVSCQVFVHTVAIKHIGKGTAVSVIKYTQLFMLMNAEWGDEMFVRCITGQFVEPSTIEHFTHSP